MKFTALGGKTEVGPGRLRSFNLCGQQVAFSLVRSERRRTLQLRVGVRGVEVRSPSWMSEADIYGFVVQKQDWIRQALDQTRQGAGLASEVFSSGGSLYVLGQKYQLQIAVSEERRVFLEELPQGWRVAGDPASARRLVVKWYRLKAQKVFKDLVVRWSGQIRAGVPNVVVKEQQRLWGSYSARTGNVNLNWRMLAFPAPIIEYIVIHELCHTRRLDHSRAFWEDVAAFCPDWRDRRLWLRTRAREYLF